MNDKIVTKKLSDAVSAPEPSENKSNAWLWIVLAVGVLAILGCCCCASMGGFFIYYTDKVTTPTPAAFDITPVPPAPADAIIFSDDFDRDDGIWDTYDDEWAAAWYEDGWFHLLIKESNYLSWSNAGYEFSDFVLVVDAQQMGGSDDNSYGVQFRYQDVANFYEFDISGDGYYILGKYVDDEWVDIISWTATEHINQGENFNHIEVMCRGDRIELYVNGHHLVTVTDDTFVSGDIGLIAGANEEPNVHVAFDNLEVWELSAE